VVRPIIFIFLIQLFSQVIGIYHLAFVPEKFILVFFNSFTALMPLAGNTFVAIGVAKPVMPVRARLA
tara:strand:- start:5562 stop:5762 length:201 start_codon:yes stop_codon:yes gene_type:complete